MIKFWMKKIAATAVLSVALCMSGTTAISATTGTLVGTFSGNEECPKPGGNKTAIAELAGSFCIAKFEFNDTTSVFETGEQGSNAALNGLDLLNNFTLGLDAGTDTSGTFEFADQGEGISISHLILKASDDFAVYALGGAVSGSWMTNDLANHGISHISFFGNVSTVPVPAALPLFLTALAGLGLYGRRRRKTA